MKRIAAIVLPDLPCELVRQRTPVNGPLGVIFEGYAQGDAVSATAVLDAVDLEARRAGVRPGQKVVEASALAACLTVQRVTHDELRGALGRVAEVALAFGATAAVRLSEEGRFLRAEEALFDTVWLDITGSAHLVGGEEALLVALCERVAGLGHKARAAIAGGPRIAQALARWGKAGRGRKYPIAGDGKGQGTRQETGEAWVDKEVKGKAEAYGARALAPLPVEALPINADVARFLGQLGIDTIGDLARLPSSAVAARLGPHAGETMALLRGYDELPLLPYEPPRVLAEDVAFEEGVESTESLLFVLRGMTSRMGVRLASRGEACARLEVTIPYDRSIARLRLSGRSEEAQVPADLCMRFHVDLPAPLSEPSDLLRALRAKLERAELAAPAVGLRLELSQITSARRVQLDLSRDVAIDPDRLPALLAELSAEIGPARVGTLEIVDAHRPEARSRLVPAAVSASAARALGPDPSPLGAADLREPTRLFPVPVPIGRVHQGAVIVIDGQAYVIERLRFEMRLHAVEWWTEEPASRDYARAWLVAKTDVKPGLHRGRAPSSRAPSGEPASGVRIEGEAFLFVDRATGEGYLQGWSE